MQLLHEYYSYINIHQRLSYVRIYTLSELEQCGVNELVSKV